LWCNKSIRDELLGRFNDGAHVFPMVLPCPASSRASAGHKSVDAGPVIEWPGSNGDHHAEGAVQTRRKRRFVPVWIKSANGTVAITAHVQIAFTVKSKTKNVR